ncbi:MAG TPA: folate-binding protein [Xanthobacteraceae bacterium]|nr:folate-binding protein [Xanthobacteraceae bacterium]
MAMAVLDDRAVVRVAGAEAHGFLDRLLTNRVPAPGEASFAALLSPQGKILADMILTAAPDEVRLELPRVLMADLLKRLALYRLRARIEIAPLDGLAVVVVWDEAADGAVPDPRLKGLGARLHLPQADAQARADATAADWHAHRIALGVPEGGRDFAYGDAFPHEADMDQLNGIDFTKGCYVGQEIVSRMQHRGTARTRIIPFAVCGAPPPPGTEIVAGGKSIGRLGSGVDGRVLASVRLDRIEDARAAGHNIEADGTALVPEKPEWARFAIPGTESAA